MSSFILGDYFEDPETIGNEYKEFCFKQGIHKSIKDYDTVFNMDHQYSVEKNLKYYFENIVSKYYSSFHNTSSLIGKDSNLWIGINDKGQITGIPTMVNLRSYINKLAYMYSLPNVRIRSNETGELYTKTFQRSIFMDTVNITVHECHIVDEFLQDTFIDVKRKYMEMFSRNKTKIAEYLIRKRLWIRNISQYCEKMDIISNRQDFRKSIIQYIEEYCNEDNKQQLIDRLRDEELFVTPPTPIFRQMRMETGNIYYWIVKWKDEQITKISNERPNPPNLEKEVCLDTYRARMTYHSKQWLEQSQGLKYFVIQISIRNINIDNLYTVEFYDKRTNTWMSLKREQGDLGPYCITC